MNPWDAKNMLMNVSTSPNQSMINHGGSTTNSSASPQSSNVSASLNQGMINYGGSTPSSSVSGSSPQNSTNSSLSYYTASPNSTNSTQISPPNWFQPFFDTSTPTTSTINLLQKVATNLQIKSELPPDPNASTTYSVSFQRSTSTNIEGTISSIDSNSLPKLDDIMDKLNRTM